VEDDHAIKAWAVVDTAGLDQLHGLANDIETSSFVRINGSLAQLGDIDTASAPGPCWRCPSKRGGQTVSTTAGT
jgi:hypothetical protein